ncbi:TPA: DUF2797 domain-containing protein [Candidatus Micrarchaeota archaeon]|nr:DUF2797 domain-containing protein [Candidatus Micrarchaeota archaeon]
MKLISSVEFYQVPTLTVKETSRGSEEKIPLGKNSQISLDFAEGHYCVSCFNGVISGSECYECGIANAWNICMDCPGDKCLQYDKNLRDRCFGGKYCVYLALFGDNVKAGVSIEARLQQRLLEQGADWGVKVFAGLNGKQARFVESLLFDKGLLGRVYAQQKIDWLEQKPAVEKLLQAKELAKNLEGFAANFVDELPVDLTENYPVPFERVVKTDALSGLVVGWKGPILFLEGEGLKAFPLGTAVGRAFE